MHNSPINYIESHTDLQLSILRSNFLTLLPVPAPHTRPQTKTMSDYSARLHHCIEIPVRLQGVDNQTSNIQIHLNHQWYTKRVSFRIGRLLASHRHMDLAGGFDHIGQG